MLALIKSIIYSLSALKTESEFELAFLFGKNLDKTSYMKRKLPKYSGVFFRLVIFIKFASDYITLFNKNLLSSEILIFAGSHNQFNSLNSTLVELQMSRTPYDLILDNRVQNQTVAAEFNPVRIKFSLINLVMSTVVFLFRFFPLCIFLKKNKLNKELNNYLDQYCKAYLFLPYFLQLLLKSKIKLVVMSNDHNISNRSLRLAADYLGIKTMYMQHASVSDIFPPLEFDYALLDGEIALETYTKCYELDNLLNSRIKKNIKKCTVILSGQKKIVQSEESKLSQSKIILGFGVNLLDDFNLLCEALNKCTESGLECIVRTHPRQSKDFLNELNLYIKGNQNIYWSDPSSQNLAEFFNEISCLIAANTSIHLEATLAGKKSFYWEMSTDILQPDYYGYLKNGLAIRLSKKFNLQKVIEEIFAKDNAERVNNIRRFSATYNTQWQNKEGKLSAYIISSIVSKESLHEIFSYEKSMIYKSILKLRNKPDVFNT